MTGFHNRVFFRTPVDIPPDAEPTGEMVRYGNQMVPVLRELRPEHEVTVLVPMKRGGQEVVQFLGGQPIRTRTERVPVKFKDDSERYREFVLTDRGNGEVKKEFDFRPADDEVLRAEMEKAASPERLLAEIAALRATTERQQQLLEAIGLPRGADPAAEAAALEGERKPNTSTFKGRQQNASA